jgi:tetratricopeptide (TPR) repeat protein
MQGSWHLWQMTRQGFTEAKRLFQTAIELSPGNSVALSHLGLTYILEAGAGLAKDPVENRNLAYQAAQRAIAKDDQDAWAHTLAAWVNHLNKENEAALRACRNALQLNPNLAYIYGVMGLAHAHLGNHEEAKIHIDNAIRLSPRDHSLPIWYLARVISALVARQPDRYLEEAIELTEAVPNFVVGWRHLAAAYAMLNRLEDAAAAIRRVIELAPHDTIESARRNVPIVDAQARDLYFKALSKAGLPE